MKKCFMVLIVLLAFPTIALGGQSLAEKIAEKAASARASAQKRLAKAQEDAQRALQAAQRALAQAKEDPKGTLAQAKKDAERALAEVEKQAKKEAERALAEAKKKKEAAAEIIKKGFLLTVKNTTKEQLEVVVVYIRAICATASLSIGPKQTKQLRHAFCCIKKIRVKTVSGPRAGTWFEFQPTLTSATLAGTVQSCRHNKIKVSENPDKTLFIDMDEPAPKKGHKLIIKNNTKNSLEARVRYGAKGICTPGHIQIKSGEKIVRKTGRRSGVTCCIRIVGVKKTSGKKAGVWYEYQPPITGAFIQSCKDNLIQVSENPDGSLHIERSD